MQHMSGLRWQSRPMEKKNQIVAASRGHGLLSTLATSMQHISIGKKEKKKVKREGYGHA